MQALDLYGEIQEYFDFQEEIEALYKAILIEVIKKEPKTVLDVGCGQGEFCHLLSYNGIKSCGVDLSTTQINLAKKKFPNLTFKAIDIAQIDTKYDCITATFDVINYISKTNLQSFFINVASLLHDGGYFIFDINTQFGFEEIAQGSLIIDNQDKFIAIDANFNDNILYTDITVFTKADSFYKKQNGTIRQYFHPLSQLESILKECGLNITKTIEFSLHSDYESDKMIIVCKK